MRLEETRYQILILEVALRFFCRDKNTQTLHKVRAERACSLCRAKQRYGVTIKQSDNQAFLQHLTSNPIAKCRDGFVAKCRGGFMSKCRDGFMSKCRDGFMSKCRDGFVAKCRGDFIAKCRGGFMSKFRGGFAAKCRGDFVAKCRGLSKKMYLCIRKH